MSLKKILSLFLLSFSLIFSSNADFNDGLDAYNAGDHKTALQEWLSLAEQGDAASQYNLGRMYIMGKGVVENMPEAKTWIKKAYENNDQNISLLAEEVWDKFKLNTY